MTNRLTRWLASRSDVETQLPNGDREAHFFDKWQSLQEEIFRGVFLAGAATSVGGAVLEDAPDAALYGGLAITLLSALGLIRLQRNYKKLFLDARAQGL